MNRNICALIAGILFGLGLAVSQMINPEKVIAFLDIRNNWDPSLILVMGAAVVVTFIGFKLVTGKNSPLFEDRFHLPTGKDINWSLLSGAAVFGAGWGLAGYCPGPAIAALALLNFSTDTVSMTGDVLGNAEPLIFLLAMVVGSAVQSKLIPAKLIPK